MTLSDTKLALKRVVGRAMCHPVVGRALSEVYRARIPSRGFVFDTSGSDVPEFVVPRLYWGFYERAEIDFVRELLDPSLDVIELGGCIGVVATHVASLLEPSSRLVSVEANPGLISTIRRNLDRNVPGHRAEVVNAAIDHSGRQTVGFHVAADAVSSHVADEGGIEVEALTLAALIERFDIGRYTLIADIEGAEAELVLEDRGVLAGCDMFITELHPERYAERGCSVSELTERLDAVHGLRQIRRRGDVGCFARHEPS